jgi:hypothetical protein
MQVKPGSKSCSNNYKYIFFYAHTSQFKAKLHIIGVEGCLNLLYFLDFNSIFLELRYYSLLPLVSFLVFQAHESLLSDVIGESAG